MVAAAVDVIATRSFLIALIHPHPKRAAAVLFQTNLERVDPVLGGHSSIQQYVRGRRCCVAFFDGAQRAAHPGPKRFEPQSNASIASGKSCFGASMLVVFGLLASSSSLCCILPLVHTGTCCWA